MRKPFPKIKPGAIVLIEKKPDQSVYMMQSFWGKHGIVLKNVTTLATDSLYEVYVEDGTKEVFHYLDLKIIAE